MYSMVLMAALSTGTDMPDWGHRWGCHGCWGGCYGCCGGCYGCWGGCYGCWGGCYGYSSCYGCYGCCGGCYGCYGCCGGCYGCYGGYGYGGVVVAPTVVATAAPKATLPAPAKTSAVTNQATVVVKAPSDARITVNGKALSRTGSEETFASPALQPGKTYTYIFKAEATRDGKKVKKTQRISVQANRRSEVDFMALGTPPPDGAAHLTVRLPADARLLVDGQVVPLTSSTRRFDTPMLKAGQTYYYTLKAEVERDGRTRTETQRVIVAAGKDLEVEFTKLTSTQAARR
jgi:uncharacterized protein (TIGR03000 family)